MKTNKQPPPKHCKYIYIFNISIAPQRALKIVKNAISFALYPDASKTSTLITS